MTAERLSPRMRLAVFVVAGALAAATGLLPGRLASPVHRLVNVDPDTASPIYDIPVDDVAMRRAGEIVDDDALFFMAWPSDEPQYQHDLTGAAHIYLSPALPVYDATRADWVLGYRVPAPVPEGKRVARRVRLGEHVELIRVVPR